MVRSSATILSTAPIPDTDPPRELHPAQDSAPEDVPPVTPQNRAEFSDALATIALELEGLGEAAKASKCCYNVELGIELLRQAAIFVGKAADALVSAPATSQLDQSREARLLRWFQMTPSCTERLRDVMQLFLAEPENSELSLEVLTERLGWVTEGTREDRLRGTFRFLEHIKDADMLAIRSKGFLGHNYTLTAEARILCSNGIFEPLGIPRRPNKQRS